MSDGLARAGFDIDLREGQANEQALVHIFLRSRVEVKTDHYAYDTGRVAIEIRQGSKFKGQGRPSGLSVTTADYWALHLVGINWVLVETDKLKELVKRAAVLEHPAGRRMLGDFNMYENVLVPLPWLIEGAWNRDVLVAA